MEIPEENQKLKQIREELQFTQSEMAKRLGLGNSTADLERGKTRLLGKTVMQLLQEFQINPLWLYGESEQKYLNAEQVNVMPKVLTVNQEGQENILMVSAKAAAGYGQNVGDRDYMAQLPAFTFPLSEYRNASFRGFQIMGDSMVPLVYSGDWVLAKAVSDFKEVVNAQIYIVVEPDSIRLKKLEKSEDGKKVNLISLNPEYSTSTISTSSIQELWEYHSKISFGIDRIKGLSLQTLQEDIREIKNRLV